MLDIMSTMRICLYLFGFLFIHRAWPWECFLTPNIFSLYSGVSLSNVLLCPFLNILLLKKPVKFFCVLFWLCCINLQYLYSFISQIFFFFLSFLECFLYPLILYIILSSIIIQFLCFSPMLSFVAHIIL